MAKMTNPANLVRSSTKINLGTDGNIWVDTTRREIYLDEYGLLSSDGVTIKCLYSYLKKEWKTDETLRVFRTAMKPITDTQYEYIFGWNLATDDSEKTKLLIRDGGWRLVDPETNLAQEEFFNLFSLNMFVDNESDTAYYIQEAGGTPVSINLPGPVNQAIKTYGDATHGNFDYRGFFIIFLREYGKTYASYDLNTAQSIAQLAYTRYPIPLANRNDQKIVADDTTVGSSLPYTGMSINYFTTAQKRNIGGTEYDFKIIIDGNNATAEQVYTFVQYQLRQSGNINAETTPSINGYIADELLAFVGDRLDTLYTTFEGGSGVYIDNFDPADTNRIQFTDDTNVIRTFPFTAAGRINFNEYLRQSPGSEYWMYFTNDDAATEPQGNNFDTAGAIIVKDADDVDIAGLIDGQTFVSFTYAYESNVQRGAGSQNKDAPITVVAIGETIAQYVLAQGDLVKSTQNVISVVAAEERNYGE